MWENATKTLNGMALDQKLAARSLPLKIASAKCGAGTVNPAQLVMQEEVADVRRDAELKGAYLSEDGLTVTFPVTLVNTGLEASFRAHQVGVYATDPDGGDILYFIAQDSDGDLIPTESDAPGFSVDWYFAFKQSAAGQITIEITEAGRLTIEQADLRYAKKDYVEELIKRYQVLVPAAGWQGSYPYTNTVSVAGITEDMDLQLAGLHIPDSATEQEVKNYNKACGFLIENGSATGKDTVIFKAYKKPATDFTVILERA